MNEYYQDTRELVLGTGVRIRLAPSGAGRMMRPSSSRHEGGGAAIGPTIEQRHVAAANAAKGVLGEARGSGGVPELEADLCARGGRRRGEAEAGQLHGGVVHAGLAKGALRRHGAVGDRALLAAEQSILH